MNASSAAALDLGVSIGQHRLLPVFVTDVVSLLECGSLTWSYVAVVLYV